MAIYSFADLFTQAAKTVQDAADTARTLQSGTTDILPGDLFHLWRIMARANEQTATAIAAANTNLASANNALGQFANAPATVADLQTGLTNIRSAAAAFKTATASWVAANFTATDLIVFTTVTTGGISSDVLGIVQAIPAAKINLLRQDQSLAALISAFAAIGA